LQFCVMSWMDKKIKNLVNLYVGDAIINPDSVLLSFTDGAKFFLKLMKLFFEIFIAI